MSSESAPSVKSLQRARDREKKSRLRAEELLESKTRDLYHANQELQEQARQLREEIVHRTQTEEELRASHKTLHEQQAQLIQSDKMAGLGQLAAGVAHEINNPIGFVKGNLTTLCEYCTTMSTLLQHYRTLATNVLPEDNPMLHTIRVLEDREDITYILEDLKTLLTESVDGLKRVTDIVQNLKSFARADEAELQLADVNEGIESTLKIIWNELKYKCEVQKDLQPLPQLYCHPGQLNQVFMNVLSNAAHAIESQGTISIRTQALDDSITVRITDTGSGIPAESLAEIFNPFFTTKPVGSGTGLGLSISYGIIEEHGGTITVESTVGEGSSFTITLPRTDLD